MLPNQNYRFSSSTRSLKLKDADLNFRYVIQAGDTIVSVFCRSQTQQISAGQLSSAEFKLSIYVLSFVLLKG